MKNLDKARRVLNEKIAQFNSISPKASTKEVAQLMYAKYRVEHGRTIGILNHFELVEDLPFDIMYKLIQCMREIAIDRWNELNAEELNTSSYFTELEEKEYSKPIPAKAKNFDLVFDDWKKIEMNQYLEYRIYTDANMTQTISNYGKFRYNPETQRDFIIIETNGISLIKPDIKSEAVDSMMESMDDGTYFPIPLIININPAENDITVIERGDKLIIPKETKIDLIEGFHNYRAITRLKTKNKDWNMPIEYRLVFKNVDRANQIIDQMNKKNHFTEKQAARIDSNNKYNYAIDNLNTSKSFKLKGSITADMRFYLYKLLPKMFEINTMQEADILIDKIETNLNYVIKQTNHYNTPFSEIEWFVYLYITKQLDERIEYIEFEELFEYINIDNIFNSIGFNGTPKLKHYEILDAIIKEANKNESI